MNKKTRNALRQARKIEKEKLTKNPKKTFKDSLLTIQSLAKLFRKEWWILDEKTRKPKK